MKNKMMMRKTVLIILRKCIIILNYKRFYNRAGGLKEMKDLISNFQGFTADPEGGDSYQREELRDEEGEEDDFVHVEAPDDFEMKRSEKAEHNTRYQEEDVRVYHKPEEHKKYEDV